MLSVARSFGQQSGTRRRHRTNPNPKTPLQRTASSLCDSLSPPLQFPSGFRQHDDITLPKASQYYLPSPPPGTDKSGSLSSLSRTHSDTRLDKPAMSQPPVSSKAAVSSNKAISSSTSQVSPAASQTQQFFSNNTRSAGGNASYQPAPRNNQVGKPKHKAGKRYLGVDEDERLAMQNIGRRGKTADITHLMNIALPPRPQQQQYHGHSYTGPRRGNTWGMGSGYHAMDKAR